MRFSGERKSRLWVATAGIARSGVSVTSHVYCQERWPESPQQPLHSSTQLEVGRPAWTSMFRQAAEKLGVGVILSEAKNLSSILVQCTERFFASLRRTNVFCPQPVEPVPQWNKGR